MNRLKEEYGDLYTEANVAIGVTHTHAGPGGYLQYFIYSVGSAGFVRETFDAQVNGIVESIRRAHENAQLGRIHLQGGELLDANINRSPTAYLNNPELERQRYPRNTDTRMTQLKFTSLANREMGIVNWFPVHATSLNNTVTLISGDNKGAASQLFEKYISRQRGAETVRNRTVDRFVAGFAQSNSADVSPNTKGTFCIDTEQPCDTDTSTCDGRNELCHGRGPAWPDAFKSSLIIGDKQFDKARELFYSQEDEKLDGEIDYRYIYLNMSDVVIESTSGSRTCRPAMGYSFAAGTTDGPGALNFRQGTTSHSFLWDLIGGLLHRPSNEQSECQYPKPILIDTGEIQKPVPWQPEILKLQILRIGQFVLICVPGEVSTMAGRRLRSAVQAAVKDHWGDVTIEISGLANDYSSYITTFEEYQIQRYEGASTIYGPHTLEAYIQEFVKLAEDMVDGVYRESTVEPQDFTEDALSFVFPVELDCVPLGVQLGDVRSDRDRDCFRPGETVEVEFWSGNPRNSLDVGGHSFLTVERLDPSSTEWSVIATDDDLSTTFAWWPSLGIRLLPYSHALLSWTVENDTAEGTYRIRHSGHAKTNLILKRVAAFHGFSTPFQIRQICRDQDQSTKLFRIPKQ